MDARMNFVFIVDDSQPQRLLLQQGFYEVKHWEMTTLNSAEAAVALEESPHLIILDYHLKQGLTGLDAVKAVRRAHPHSVLIVHTGHSDPDLVFPALAAGADEWFVKGQQNSELRRIIRAGRVRREYRNRRATEVAENPVAEALVARDSTNWTVSGIFAIPEEFRKKG